MSIALILTILYFVGINVFGMTRMYEDRVRALAGERRLPESALLALAMIGGSIGIALGVASFRHKKRDSEFNRKLTIIIVAQVLVIAALVVFA